MKYSLDILSRAGAVINKRRNSAVKIFEENRELAYKTVPEIADIDASLSSSGSLISQQVLYNKENIKETINKIKENNTKLINKKKKLLKDAGLGEDFLDIKYTCKKCNDTGYVDAMPCSCLLEVAEKLYNESSKCINAGNVDLFESFNLNYYPEKVNQFPCKSVMESIYNNCKKYAEEFSLSSPNLLIFGGTGIGKTHISLAIAKKVEQKGFNAIYISAPDLFTSLEKERFNQENVSENMQSVTECDLLVIDDLGAEFTTSFTISALYTIINSRINSEKPTIITANLVPSEIAERYSDRIASRLIGSYEHLHFIGNDIRILKKKGL